MEKERGLRSALHNYFEIICSFSLPNGVKWELAEEQEDTTHG